MSQERKSAGLGISWQLALLQVAILASTVITPVATDITCVGLALWAMLRPLAALQSLSVFVVIRTMNPSLIQSDAVSSALGWGIPLLVSIRILPFIKSADLRVVGPLWLFCIVAIGCSIATSLALTISLMKATSLAVIVAAVLVANFRLSDSDVKSLGRWLRTLATVVATLSIASLVRPSIAYLPDTHLLQGILSQPQALGAFLAPFSAAYVANWLFRSHRIDPGTFAIMAVLLLCMLLTLSRTAALATVLGVGMSVLGGRIPADRPARSVMGRLLGFSLVAILILCVTALAGSGMPSSISGFVLKHGEHNVSDAFLVSRGGGMISELRNFASSPIVGHGFGVYADGVFPSGIVEVAGIPVSAPVEKGVLPSAVLEETGLVGFLCFTYLVFAVTGGVWKRAEPSVLALVFGCLFVNLGEAVLLSPGNIGLHVWLLIGWCLRAGMSESDADAEMIPNSVRQPAVVKPYVNLLN